MMGEFDIDIDYNNVQSDILSKEVKVHADVFQQDVQYVNWRKDIDLSSVEGEEQEQPKFKSILSKLGDTTEVIKTYGANKDGKSYGEVLDGKAANTPNKEIDVRILGMKPLVFTLVSLGVVIAVGIGIAKIGTKAGAK